MEYLKNISKNNDNLYPHAVLLAVSNEEGLLKHTKLATLEDEVTDWLNDNVGDNEWTFYYIGLIGFKSKEDAMGFILRWA